MADRQPAPVPSIWIRPRRGTRGPSPDHELAEVAAAAIRIAKRGGLAALSMRALATELGTAASTLYNYVVSRDELLDLMIDTAMADFTFTPQPGDWLTEVVRLAEATRSLYVAEPWLLDARATSSAPGPNTLAWFEHCLEAMKDLDRTATAKMEAIGVLVGVIRLFAQSASAPTAFDFSAIDAARHPHLTATLTTVATGAARPADDLFERSVRAVLVGLVGDRP